MRDRLFPCVTILALAIIVGGCGQSALRMYDGPRRNAAEVARVECGDDVAVLAVDDQLVSDRYPSLEWKKIYHRTIELTPGEHRLAVSLWHDRGKLRPLVSTNNVTLRHTFAAGAQCCILAKTTIKPVAERKSPDDGGKWTPYLASKGSDAPLALAEVGARARTAIRIPPPQPGDSPFVSGIAQLPGKGWTLNAAGRELLLAPKAQAAQWVADKEQQMKGARGFGELGSPVPDKIKNVSYRTIGYGEGQFWFSRVQPGEYLLILLTKHPQGEFLGVSDVTVAPGQLQVSAPLLQLAGFVEKIYPQATPAVPPPPYMPPMWWYHPPPPKRH